jgi:glycosyltransferase involved in cell wall biosynthesis
VKVAIVHYWLVGMRGGEKVVEALCELFPDADIFTHVYNPRRLSETILRHRITTTFIASLPFAEKLYKVYLPLMPLALEQLDLEAYDLVISSESGPAKGVLTRPDALHVCYCHTPMRYAWSGYHFYQALTRGPKRWYMVLAMHRLRLWDYAAAARVDHFIANSATVSRRIAKYYRRSSVVVHPPVTLGEASGAASTEDFYLFVSQLVSYKRADIVIEAFNRLRKRLVVVGTGEEAGRLRKLAGPTIELVGWQNDQSLQSYYSRSRALVFVAEEDFGIVPVEAMSAGKPVIALNRGGAAETVVHGKTGILFDDQTTASLVQAVADFEKVEAIFDPAVIRHHAAGFSKEVFNRKMMQHLTMWLEMRRSADGTVDSPKQRSDRIDALAPA